MVETIWMGLILVETELHTSSAEWKILMLQILPINIKKWVSHLKHDQ
jgi:hypothetical protein